MSSYADTIRDYTTNTERYDGQWHRLPTEQEVLAALDALLADKEEMSRICDKWEREYAALLAENQRLREALAVIATRQYTAALDAREMRQIAREALAGDAE